MDSQCLRVCAYTKKYGSITSTEASTRLGIAYLPARIKDLKDEGYEVTYVWEDGLNRYGEKTRYKRYFVTKKEEQPTLTDTDCSSR